MNKILIVSDNHGIDNISYLKKDQNCTYAFHAGDSQFPYNSEQMQNFDLKVRGNCDYDADYPEEIITQVQGVGNVLILHGHFKNVKSSLYELKQYCKSKNINLCVYGHTHVIDIQYIRDDDLLIINPGSATYSRSEYTQTYVTLQYDKNNYKIEIKDIKHNKKKQIQYLRK